MNPCRILVVEDESIVAMDMQEQLAGMGYQPVGLAATGEHALELFRELRPDLVLMDIRLDGTVDGISAAEEIHRKFRTPVIFLTAHSDDETLERAKLTEPYGYILKPSHERELKSAIEVAIHKHRADEEVRRLNRLYDVLSQVNQCVVRVQTREELFSSVCRLVVERGAIDLAWIGWLDSASSKICPVAHYGEQSHSLTQAECHLDERPEGQGKLGKAIREGRPFVCNECLSTDCLYPQTYAPARLGFRSCASFPLQFRGEVCGVLNVCETEPGFFREREVQLLKEVAADISFALEKIEINLQQQLLTERLQRQTIFLQTIIDAMPFPVFYKDAELRYLGCNTAYEQFFGARREHLVGKTVFESWPGELAEIYHRADRELLRSGASQVYEAQVETGEGMQWDVVFHKAVFRDPDGRVCGLIGVVEDITRRKRAEEDRVRVEGQLRQAQKMEALGTLAGGIAHDFNNILGIIVGYTEVALLDASEGSPIRESLQEVLTAAGRAKELVQQILAFSRKNEMERRPVQVGLIVKEAVKMLRASLPSTIEIRQNVTSKSLVLADPTQIHQVLMNLCTNAAHAMRDQGGVLDVTLTDFQLSLEDIPSSSDLKPGPYLRLTVTDTGHGIDPAILDRIFDPFFTTKEQGVGTGLGLAVVHGIVKHHGGEIEVASHPGKGTSFRVLFPALESTAAQAMEQTAPLPRGTERILVVDDEPALAMLSKEILERLGYRVEYRTDGIGALEVFRTSLSGEPFDLVISDMTMPHMTGEDLARELLSLRPDLPILLCTGFSEKMTSKRAESRGIHGLLMKPVVTRELARMVREALDKQKK